MNEKIEIKKDVFERLCALQCDIKEIAGMFNCSEEQIKAWCERTYNISFEEVYQEKSIKGKVSLRNLQFKLAEKNATMAIYLGKVYLNQDDKKNNEE